MQGSIKKLQEEISAFGAKKQELDETVSQQKEVRGREGRERRETRDRRERERAPILSCVLEYVAVLYLFTQIAVATLTNL